VENGFFMGAPNLILQISLTAHLERLLLE